MRLAPTSHRARCAPLTSLASSGDHDAQRAKGYSVSAPERPSRGISSPSASPYPPTGRRASSPCTRTPRSASLTLTGRRPRGAKSAPEPGLSDDRRSDDTGREPGHVTIGSIAPAACAFLGFDRASIGLVLRICGANGSGHRPLLPLRRPCCMRPCRPRPLAKAPFPHAATTPSLPSVVRPPCWASVVGAPGFEPGNGGTKIRCLTAWRRPKPATLSKRAKPRAARERA